MPPPPSSSPVDSNFPLTPSSSSGQGLPSSPRKEGKKGRLEFPLEHYTGLIQVIHDDEDRIDVEEEARVYRAFDLDEDDADAHVLSPADIRYHSAPPPSRPQPQHVSRSHARTPSSVFSNDIWVGESGDAEKDTSFARGVRIVGWTSVGDKRGGAYVVYDCAILTTARTTIHILKRYSAFAALDASLMRTLPAHLRKYIPPLPPRAPLARYRAGFLEKRRKALQAWLSGVLLHPEIGGCSVVREWVMAG